MVDDRKQRRKVLVMKQGSRLEKKETDRFFHLDLIDFDPEELGFELLIEGKLVIQFHLLSFRWLVQDACFATRKWLQRTTQFWFLYRCTIFDLLQRQLVHIIEQEEDQGLEQWYLKFFTSLLCCCYGVRFVPPLFCLNKEDEKGRENEGEWIRIAFCFAKWKKRSL